MTRKSLRAYSKCKLTKKKWLKLMEGENHDRKPPYTRKGRKGKYYGISEHTNSDIHYVETD